MNTLTSSILNKINEFNKKETFKLPCGNAYCDLTSEPSCKGYCSLLATSTAKLSKKVMKCKNGK